MMSAFSARKRFGQHFLVDQRAIERIVDALSPEPGSAVLEIGPGRGALTERLLERTHRLAAVEIDRDLVASLRERFPPHALRLYSQDVLSLDFGEVRRALGSERRLWIVGNLPYNISKPVVRALVDRRRHVERAVLMFQREVADRLTAQPGLRDYGPLAIYSGFAYAVDPLFLLKPGAFRPPPRVDSRVTRWRSREVPFSDDDAAAVRRALDACFARPRKTLRNNLIASQGDAAHVDRILAAVGVDGALRPGSVARQQYLEIGRRLASHPA